MEPRREVYDFGVTNERLPDGRWTVTATTDEFAGLYGTGSWTVPTRDDALQLAEAVVNLIATSRALIEHGTARLDDMAAAASHASRQSHVTADGF